MPENKEWLALADQMRRGTWSPVEPILLPAQIQAGLFDTSSRGPDTVRIAWNHGVHQLQEIGHANSSSFLRRLKNHQTQLGDLLQDLTDKVKIDLLALIMVQAQGEICGFDKLVFDAIYNNPGRIYGWSATWDGDDPSTRWVYFHPDSLAIFLDSRLGLDPTIAAPAGVESWVEVDGYITWRRAIEWLESRMTADEIGLIDHMRTLQVVNFRLALMCALVWQYEVFGDVRKWDNLEEQEKAALVSDPISSVGRLVWGSLRRHLLHFLKELSEKGFLHPLSDDRIEALMNGHFTWRRMPNDPDVGNSDSSPLRWIGDEVELVYLIMEARRRNLLAVKYQVWKSTSKHFCKYDGNAYNFEQWRNVASQIRKGKKQPRRKEQIDELLDSVKALN